MSWPLNYHLAQTAVNYPRNTWWVAAFSHEITRQPAARFILDRPVVLYRTLDGRAVGLDDRCPHRWAPLSKGQVIDDNIECPYHGITFGADGECVKIPTQKSITAGCRVHSYPLIDDGLFVWIWMGDLDRIAEYDPPHDLSWTTGENWSVASGLIEMDGNYMQLHDNVMDLTHFGFVHRNTLGVSDWVAPPKVSTTKTTVTFRQEFLDRALQPFHASITQTPPDRRASRFVTEGAWISPALHAASESIEFDDTAPGKRSKFRMQVAHATTPINMGSYRYYYVLGWDVDLPAEVRAGMKPGTEAIFGEDKVMLEAINDMLKRDSRGTDYPEIKLQADTPQLHARQKLKELMDRE